MKIKWRLLFSCIIISCLLTACKFDAKGIREISKVDVNSTEITLDLTDNVTVNAEITPKTDYENGLSTYFGNVWSEEGYSYESWKENATFMGKSIPDIFSKIIEISMNEEQIRECKETFDLYDIDMVGYLDLTKAKDIINSFGIMVTDDEIKSISKDGKTIPIFRNGDWAF